MPLAQEVMAPGANSMLRLALLCHLSVAGANVRLATNIECLAEVSGEVFLDLSGARTAAFLEGIPSADVGRALWRRRDLAAQQPGRAGR